MDCLRRIVVLVIFCSVLVESRVTVINRYDNEECVLDKKLVEEIASYKNVTKRIMKAVTEDLGDKMYEE